MDSPIFLISFSHNDQNVTVDRCHFYDQLVQQTVQATNGDIQPEDIDSFQYEASFGIYNATITARNSKALHRIPKQQFYTLKCITNQSPNKRCLSVMNNIGHAKKRSISRKLKNYVKISYKLLLLSRREDSMLKPNQLFPTTVNYCL